MKILWLTLTLLFVITSNSESADYMMRLQQQQILQQAADFANQAKEAAIKGDFTTTRQKLDQIDTLTRTPTYGSAVQNSPIVQEARKYCTQVEENSRKAGVEKLTPEQQAKEKEIAVRIAFEKERTQKQIAQRQEDDKKAILRQQQQSQSQAPKLTPQQPTSQMIIHQDGRSYASSQLGNVVSAAKTTNPQIIPGYQTDKPKEASLKTESLGDAALLESKTNSVSQHLIRAAKERLNFKIDPNTDPLFVQANQTIKNPQETMKEEISEVQSSDNDREDIRTCEEGGDEYKQTCSKRLEIVLKITPEVRNTVYYCPGNHEFKERRGLHYKHWTDYCPGRNCRSRVDVTPKKVEILSEKWVDDCTILEDHVEKGLCRYVLASRSPQNETRMIQGELIPRDHFEEHYTYACFKGSKKSCAGLREQGCYQIKSICQEQAGDRCVLWQQTYSCPSDKKQARTYKSSNKESPFCLTGDCADTSYEANTEMMNVMSHLYVLREAQNDLKNFKVIFKGQHRWCTRNCLDFRDCCGNERGWGISLNLSSCDKAEIELRTLRDKNLCIQVGTYCAERDKVFNSCLRKKTTFCCYGTKMARLIQQYGRAQLGIGFGSPEHPICDGLSPEQLNRIDFSKINFSEIFEDIKGSMASKDQGQSLAQVSTDRLQNNMALLTKPSSNSNDHQKRQTMRGKGL